MNKKNISEMINPFSHTETYIKLIGIIATVLFCVFYFLLHKYFIKEWTRLTALGEYRICYCLLIAAFGIYIRNHTLSFYRYNLLFMKSLGISNHYVCLAALRNIADFYLIWQAAFLFLNAQLSPAKLLGVLILFLLGGLAVFLLATERLLPGMLRCKGNSAMIEFKEATDGGSRIFRIEIKDNKSVYSKYKVIRHIKREMAVLLRRKSILIAKIIISILLAAVLIVSKSMLLNEIVCGFVLFFNIAFLEHLYIQDNQNRFLYFQMGESSKAFLLKKIATALFFTGEVIVLLFVKALLMKLQWYFFVLSGFVWLTLVVYYSLFYFFMYTHLKDEYNSLHDILFLVITVLLPVPPFTLFSGIWFYICGKKRWEREKYVENK